MMTLLAPMISSRRSDRSPVTRQVMLASPIGHLRRRPKTLFPACRMLSRQCGPERDPSERRTARRARPQKITSPAEGLSGRSEGNQSRGDQRSNAGDCHQPTRHLILLGASADLGIQLADRVIETGLCLDQDQQYWPSFVGQATCCVLYDRNQACGIRRSLWSHLSELRPPLGHAVMPCRAKGGRITPRACLQHDAY